MEQAAWGGVRETVPGGVPEHGDVALRDMVRGHGRDGLGLDEMILMVFSNLNDSNSYWSTHFTPEISV